MEVQRLILLAHGSRDPRWREPFEQLAQKLKQELGEDRVRLAFMEFAPPSLAEVSRESAEEGIGNLRVLPLFMAGGGHVDRDISAQIRKLKEDFPHLHIELLPPMGEHPEIANAMREIAKEAIERGSGQA